MTKQIVNHNPAKLDQGLANCSWRGLCSKYFRFYGHTICNQFYYGTVAVIDICKQRAWLSSKKLDLQKQITGWFGPMGYCWWTLELEK